MRFRLRRIFLAVCLPLLGAGLFGAEGSNRVRQTPVPDWVTPTDETHLAPLDDVPAGLEYLLVDSQTRVANESAYSHITYRIRSNTGLQEGSQLAISFDPDYQFLDYHFVRIIRDGQIIDHYDPAALKIIQQESELDRHLYDGRLTALLIFKDVRVGDIVDYAYTERGFNPVFGRHYIDDFTASWTVPVRHQRYRLLMPNERIINSQTFGSHQLRSIVNPTGLDGPEFVWEGRDLPQVVVDDDTPAWHPSHAFQELTEFNSWRQVAEWALPLYDLSKAQTPELAAKAEELTRGQPTPEKKILALLDFVQRDIRYLGMELGPGSHRPNPPATVLAQRFGDCKDKALLFCALLQHIGVDARPALVNSWRLSSVARWLPSPYAFDHVITRVRLNGQDYWLDPTRAYQRGPLLSRAVSALPVALVIAPETNDLTWVPHISASEPKIVKGETFTISGFDTPSTLNVVTRYSGRSAENIRAYLATTSAEEYSRVLINVYARLYPEITTAIPLKWEDQSERNQIVVTENYRIPKIWTIDPATHREEAEFFPLSLRNVIQRPDSPRRSSPLAVGWPFNIQVNTIVRLPQPWPIRRANENVSNETFAFQATRHSLDNLVTMTYSWEFKDSVVSADRVAAYSADLDRVRALTGFTLIHRPGAKADANPSAFAPNWTLLLLATVTFAAASYAVWRIHRLPSPSAPPLLPNGGPSGLGGWLAFVTFGVLFRPLAQFYRFLLSAPVLFSQRQWVNTTTPDLPNYHLLSAPLLALEACGPVLLLVFDVFSVWLLFRKHRRFPAVTIGLFVFTAAYHGLKGWMAYQVPWAVKDPLPFVQMLLFCLVWIPYLRISQRVKNTFVN